MRSEGNAPKNGEPTVGFSITTMLHHTGRFWSMISYQRTLGQHWNILFAPLTWLDLIFTCSVAMKSALKGQCFCDTTDNFKNVMEELKRHSQSDFLECFQHLHCRWQNCVVA
jgi:hypothetical protein